jgi:hypothetical protein
LRGCHNDCLNVSHSLSTVNCMRRTRGYSKHILLLCKIYILDD